MGVAAGKRFVVTGGAGFIGSHLVDALFREGATSVAVVDNLFAGRDANLDEARRAHGEDLRIDRDDASSFHLMSAVVEREKPDVVFNLATKALRYSFLNPPGAFDINVQLALTQLELLRKGAYGRLVHVSSSEVYGTAQTVPMTEAHPLLAETTYAAGKAAADLAVSSYVRMFGVDALVVRPFNNYGPRQIDHAFSAIIPLTVRRILSKERPVIEGDGLQTRDFVYVTDTVDVMLRLFGRADAKGAVLNVGSGRETSMRELVSAIAEIMGYEGDFDEKPARPADVRRHCGSAERVEGLLGPLKRVPLREGLQRTVDWFLEFESGAGHRVPAPPR